MAVSSRRFLPPAPHRLICLVVTLYHGPRVVYTMRSCSLLAVVLKLYYCMNGLVFVGGDGREGLAGGAEDVRERQIDVCLAWGSAGVCCAFFGSGSS